MENSAPKPNGKVTITVMGDGTAKIGGKPVSWADAHKVVTDGRKRNQSVKRSLTAAKQKATKAQRAEKKAAQIARIEKRLAKLTQAA